MKNSLWIIIAIVTGVVGFLVGYSVSGFTGSRGAAQIAAHGAPAAQDAPPAKKADAGGSPGATAHAAGGYGGAAPAAPAHGAAAGGYGTPAPQPAQKVAVEKPKAAGY